MCGNIVCIAAVLLGIDAGWQPLPEGGLLYIIQIEPQLLETLNSGETNQSHYPANQNDVRAFRIMVGTAELPRELPPADVGSPTPTVDMTNQPPADPFLSSRTTLSAWPDLSGRLPSLRPPGAESPVAESLGAPDFIRPDPHSKPIGARQAGYLERPAAVPKGQSRSPSEQEPRQERPRQQVAEDEKPWTPLIVALFTLFGSLGANLYLGWITWNARSRCRTLAQETSHLELE